MRLTYASKNIRNKAHNSPNLSSARRSLLTIDDDTLDVGCKEWTLRYIFEQLCSDQQTDVNVVNIEVYTPFLLAVREGRGNVVRQLLRNETTKESEHST